MRQKLSLIKYYKLVPEALTGDKKYLEIVSSYMTLNNYTWSGLSTQSKNLNPLMSNSAVTRFYA